MFGLNTVMFWKGAVWSRPNYQNFLMSLPVAFCNAAERVLNRIVLFNMCIAATATGQVKRSGHQKVHLSKDLFLPHLGSSYPKYTSTLQYLILDKPISICSRAGFFRVGAETDTGDGKPLISSMSGWQPSHPAKHRMAWSWQTLPL